MNNFLSYLVFFIFFTLNSIFANDIVINQIFQKYIQIGQGFDLLKNKIKNSPFENIQKEIFNDTQKVTFNLKFIPNNLSLAKELNLLNNNEFLLQNSKKEAFFEDSLIDDYSLNYLLDVKVINSFEILKNPKLSKEAQKLLKNSKEFKKLYGDYFINGILKGGEFLALIKINTNSKLDYKNIKRDIDLLNLKWSKKDRFLKILKNLSKNHQIDIKNLIISNSEILPSDNLEDLFKNAEIFPSKIYSDSVDIEMILTPYEQLKSSIDNKISKKIKTIYLNYQTLKNDLFFILRNDSQFRFNLLKKKQQLINYKKLMDLLSDNFLLMKLNYQRFIKGEINYEDIIKNIEFKKEYEEIEIPQRYKATIPNKKVKVPSKKIFATNKGKNIKDHNNTKAPWIDLLSYFHIEKNGKILFLTSKIEAKNSKGEFLQKENNEIVLDTYIDFPGLRFIDIKNKKGELFTNTLNSKNNWKKFKGEGVIKSAYCGYDIEGEEKRESMGCVEINFKDLKIDFEHEEDYLKLPFIYLKAKDIFSFTNFTH